MVKCITYHVPSYFPRNIKNGGWSVILQMQGVLSVCRRTVLFPPGLKHNKYIQMELLFFYLTLQAFI